MRNVLALAAAAFLVALLGCSAGPHSPAGFRLPEGNAERGKALFVSLGCSTCHEMAGSDLPKPTVRPTVPVVLGGTVDYGFSDGYLVTSIINPSHEYAAYPKSQIMENGHSRMPSYADRLTVRELTDLVTYLQSQYRLRQVMPQSYF
jgi:mono/diheme cytochrome c family protein